MISPHILSGSANPRLAMAIAEQFETTATVVVPERFADGELRPVVRRVRGDDVYVVQPTAPPVNDHLVELLLLLDACRRERAGRITAVVPYFAYTRPDPGAVSGATPGMRMIADAIARAGADRLVVMDPHTTELAAVSPIPVETLTAVPVLSRHLGFDPSGHTVVVAPDLGAARLAERFAAPVQDTVAIVRKFRQSGAVVNAVEILGDIERRPVVLVDDMICTGATVEAALRLLHGHAADIVVAATHGPLTAAGATRLRALGVRRIVVTDSIALPDTAPPIEVCSIAPLLAEAIADLHSDSDRPLGSTLQPL
ncbi:ribose-phosphate diphosphokinase [Nocardia sp. IFM 10818]